MDPSRTLRGLAAYISYRSRPAEWTAIEIGLRYGGSDDRVATFKCTDPNHAANTAERMEMKNESEATVARVDDLTKPYARGADLCSWRRRHYA
jgi:hypothetical protein